MKIAGLSLKHILLGLSATFFLGSCSSIWKKNDPKALARVGENYLYHDEVNQLMGDNLSKEDSASFVTEYINDWASKQLLLEKAKINLPEDKVAHYDALVDNYRTDLYTRAYKEALMQKRNDSTVTRAQLEAFYEAEKENFKLNEMLVKLRFVALPKEFINKVEVAERLKNFGEKDRRILDSISVQFQKKNFNDSLWVSASRVIDQIPPLTADNVDRQLKKSQFLNLEDDNGVYLAKILDVRNVNDIAPLSYIEPTMEQVLLNRRRLTFLRQLESEIIDEAIQDNEFEVFGYKSDNGNQPGNGDEEGVEGEQDSTDEKTIKDENDTNGQDNSKQD